MASKLRSILFIVLVFAVVCVKGQAPNISYSSPQVYTAGMAITPLAPVNTGGAVPVSMPVTLSSAFIDPFSIAIDKAGNIYVSDIQKKQVTKIPADGGALVNIGSNFSSPSGVAVDGAGNVFVIDGSDLKKINSSGSVTILETFTASQAIISIAADAAGNLYGLDPDKQVIQKFPVGGGSPTIIASDITNGGALAVDSTGNVYTFGYAGMDQTGVDLTTVLKITSASNGRPQTINTLSFVPEDMAVDPKGNIYLINKHSIITIPSGSSIPVLFASYPGIARSVAVDSSGNVYAVTLSDTSHAVSKFKPGGYVINPALPAGLIFDGATGTIRGMPVTNSSATNYTVTATNTSGKSQATINITVNLPSKPIISYASPQVYTIGSSISPLIPLKSGGAVANQSPIIFWISGSPRGLVIDTANNVYMADSQFNAIQKQFADGQNIFIGGFHNFKGLSALALDADQNLFVIDIGNHALKEVTTQNDVITISTAFVAPYGIAVDAAHNLYVSDAGTNVIKKITANGGTVTLASGFNMPGGIAVDGAGNIYVADRGSNEVKVVPSGGGPVHTIGSGFNLPMDVTVDIAGNVYVADYNNHAVKEILVGGGIITLYTSSIFLPAGIALDNAGNVCVSDDSGGAVIKIPGGIAINPALPAGLSFNQTTGSISGRPTVVSPPTNYTVTASNVAGNNTANVNIAVAPAGLSGLAINAGTLNPVFDPSIVSYAVGEPNSQTSINVTPTALNPTATITVNGVAVASGSPSGAIALNVGVNTITTKVTAHDGSFLIYMLTITRAAPSANASLFNLALGWDLSPAFDPAITSYTASVSNATTSIAVTPSTADAHAMVTVNGTAVLSTARSAPIALSPGPNTLTTVVTAQDGVTTKTYTITVSRATTGGAALSNLFISNGTLSPAFNYLTTGYSATVSHATTSITVTPVAADITGTITVNGSAVASRTASAPISLAPGPNTITILVTAHGKPNGTYTLTITRAQPLENASLANLHLSSGTLSPAFIYTNTGYTANVSNTTASIMVTPTAADPNATLKVNRVSVGSGTASAPVSLGFGINTITVMVTTPDGTLNNTYTLTITRAQPSQNAALAYLHLSSGTLSPAFIYTSPGYTTTVANAVASITATPIVADPNATVTVNGTPVASGSPSGPIALNAGNNTITVVVTAQNGVNTRTYTVTVTRAVGGSNIYEPGLTTGDQAAIQLPANNNVVVHPGVSPNGDGINDFLMIDGILAYPDNQLSIISSDGRLVYEAKGYNNRAKVFDGHSSKNGRTQLPGTYFYRLDYTAGGIVQHKTGYLVLKY